MNWRCRPKSSWRKRRGSASYVMRAILNGRGDEIVELARTNLR